MIYDNILDTIGKTPIVKLNKIGSKISNAKSMLNVSTLIQVDQSRIELMEYGKRSRIVWKN